MSKTNLYWQVYRNLEREFLELAETIFINDKQQEVYSMKIADLLVRTAIEIEALAKELYLANNGAVVPDDEMYFDTVCIKHLCGLWNIDKKMVLVVSPDLHFDEEKSKVLYPLHNADKRGKCDWKKAYQDVKHNRVRELHKGTVKHLLHALAALYVLNLYNKEEEYLGYDEKFVGNVDLSFGSSLFAVKMHRIWQTPNDLKYKVSSDYDSCVYLQDYEPGCRTAALNAIDEIMKGKRDIVWQKMQEQILQQLSSGEHPDLSEQNLKQLFSKISGQGELVKEAAMPLYLQGKLEPILNMRYNVVLNKKQYSK